MSEQASTTAIAAVMEQGGAIGAVTGGYQTTPYVTFATQRSAMWTQFVLKMGNTINEGDPVLVRPDPYPPIKLTPFSFFLFGAEQFFCIRNKDTFELLGAFKQEAENTKEEIHAAIIAIVDGNFVPATCSFRTAKTGAAKDAVRALGIAKTPDWANISAAHKETLEISVPWMRFFTNVTLSPRVARGGMKYVQAKGATIPTPKNMAGALTAWMAEPANQAAVKGVWESYNFRLGEYTAVMK